MHKAASAWFLNQDLGFLPKARFLGFFSSKFNKILVFYGNGIKTETNLYLLNNKVG